MTRDVSAFCPSGLANVPPKEMNVDWRGWLALANFQCILEARDSKPMHV